jgi:TonB family protein
MLKISFSSNLCCFLTLFCTYTCAPLLHAQSNEADLKVRLIDKPLYLRGFWRDDTLHFDSSGKLKGNSDPTTFTLSGFELRTLQLKHDKLVLEGRRIGLELADNKQRRVALNVNVRQPANPQDESMHIDIAASPSGDYGPALDAIFANGLAEVVPSLPWYWKAYAAKNFLPIDTTTTQPATKPSDPAQQATDPSNIKPKRIGGGVKPPKLLHSKEPEFSDPARGLKYSGNTLINFWLQPDGTVSHMSIVRPLGLGLDERALAAVQKYTFSPATMNDKPVLVELNVEVNFQIF